MGFLGLGVVVLGAYRNLDLLNSPFYLYGNQHVRLIGVVVASCLAGFLIALYFGLIREGKYLFDRMRPHREERRVMAIEERYYEGVQAVVEGREEDALRHFRMILDSEPNHFNALLKAGEVLVAKGKYAEGIDYHQRARQARPEDRRPLYALANDYATQGDLD